MIKRWNISNIRSEIQKITFAGTDPRMDGFVTWGCKQDLYEILWFIEDELDKFGTYSELEEELLKKREQTKLLRALGKQ
jgi:hypothetical protein